MTPTHVAFHETPTTDEPMATREVSRTCTSCGGVGNHQRTEYYTNYGANGSTMDARTVYDPCWSCGGSGRVTVTERVADPPAPRPKRPPRSKSKAKPNGDAKSPAGDPKVAVIDVDQLAGAPALTHEERREQNVRALSKLTSFGLGSYAAYTGVGTGVAPWMIGATGLVVALGSYAALRGPLKGLAWLVVVTIEWVFKLIVWAIGLAAFAALLYAVGTSVHSAADEDPPAASATVATP